MRPLLLSLIALCLLSGCGYTLLSSKGVPIPLQVPFIQGDTGGELTRALINRLSESLQYRPVKEGHYLLKISFVSGKDEHVGFRYDKTKEGERLETLVPSETRSSILVEVELLDSLQGKRLFGPARVSASHAFDHDWYASWEGVNVFSLGQVTDFSDAKDGVYPLLARRLAEKIVDLLDQLQLSAPSSL